MMRYALLVLFLFTVGQYVFSQPSEVTDETGYFNNDSDKVKTILIGNVTEISYGYNWFNPEDIFGYTLNQYSESQSHTLTLSQYFIINNCLLQSGFEFNMFQAASSAIKTWDSINSSQITVYDTINTHYLIDDGDSIPEYVIEQRTITQSDTIGVAIANNIINKISCFTIPLNLGYRWRFDKFALYLKVGSRFNFITSSKGKIYDAKNDGWVKLNDLIQKKFYLSGTACLALEYPFSVLGSVIIEPEYRYNLYSRVNPVFAKNFQQFGLKMGVQFWF